MSPNNGPPVSPAPGVQTRFVTVMVGFAGLATSAAVTLDRQLVGFVLGILALFAMRTWMAYQTNRWQTPISLAGMAAWGGWAWLTLEGQARVFIVAVLLLLGMRMWVAYRATRWDGPKE